MATRAKAAGVELRTYGSLPHWAPTKSQDDNWPELARLLHGPGTRDDILAEAAAFDPDVLVIDAMLGAGFDAAAQIGCPTSVLVHVLHSSFVHEWGDSVMQRSVRDLLAGVDRVLALTPPGFDVDHEVGANTAFVGPIQPLGASSARPTDPVPAELSEPGDPWVLLSLSTTQQGQLQALPVMLSALGSLPVRALLTLGPAVPHDTVRPPANVTVREYVAHEDVLPHVAAVLTHGGLSTISNALAHGVPLVCVPQGREQPINARRVEAIGAGRMLDAGSSGQEIAKAVDEVLGNPGFREAAAAMAQAIARLGAGAVATTTVEGLAN
jgi:MGT family glycosyltransferase